MAFETERMRLPVVARGSAARRTALFRESLIEMTERWALGLGMGPEPQANSRRA